MRSIKLTEFQQELLEKMYSPSHSGNHLLVFPVGAGSLFMIVKAIERSIEEGAIKILLLSFKDFRADQYFSLMSERISGARLVKITRSNIREIEFESDVIETPYIFIGRWQDFKYEDIQKFAFSTKWDLIVGFGFDINLGPDQARDTILFLNSIKTDRRIFITNPVRFSIAEQILSGVTDTFDISRMNITDLLPQSEAKRKVLFHHKLYMRTPEEAAFIQAFRNYLKIRYAKTTKGKKIKELMGRILSSSYYSAELILRSDRTRFLDRAYEMPTQQKGIGNDDSEDESSSLSDIYFEQGKQMGEQKVKQIIIEIQSALEYLDLIIVDSKQQALLEYLQVNRGENEKIWIYTPYKSTIEYLENSLHENFPRVIGIHSQTPSTYKESAIQTFSEFGGIIIGSDISIGLDFPIDCLAFYDAVNKEGRLLSILELLIGQNEAQVATKPLEVAVFDDSSGFFDDEQTRIERMVQSLVDVSSLF